MKKIIIIAVLIGLFAFPVVSLGSTFVSALIQGKSVEEAVQILANEIDNLMKRVLFLEKKVDCLELVKITPDMGPQEWINIDIRGFYKTSLKRFEEWQSNPSRTEEQQSEIIFWQRLVNEAKPLYEDYIGKCGEKK